MVNNSSFLNKTSTFVPQYCIDDSFVDKIKECLKAIHHINYILARFKNTTKNQKLLIEMEYTKLMINLMIPLLNSFITEHEIEEFKNRILVKIEFFKNVFILLREEYKNAKTKHFSHEEEYLFLRNYEILIQRESFIKTKSGLTFLRFLLYYIQKLEDKVNEIYIKDFRLTKEDIVKYAYKNAHVKYISQVIHYYLFPKSPSVFDLSPYSERWKNILDITDVKITTTPELGKTFNKSLYFLTNLTYALFYKLNIHEFNLCNPVHNLKMLYFSLYYLFNPSVAKFMRKSFSLTPNMGIIERAFSSMETLVMNFFYKFTFNSIKVNHQRYVNINQDIDSKLYTKKEVRGKEKNYTLLRILSTKNLSYNFKNDTLHKSSLDITLNYFGLALNLTNKEEIKSYNLIIHVHGGGFFSQSTESHLGYLINFSNNLDCVVISIDYTVAPKAKYPDIFEENFKAYKKIVENSEKLFGFRIVKLALAGDSCGGHFCLDIAKNAIKNNVRIPDGLLLIYPSTQIIFENMGPSFGISCRDSFIEISLMGNMQKAVLDLEKYDLDYYEKDQNLNFYKTSKEIISMFPKTYIILASNDPMKDESFILADFLLQHNVKVSIKEYLYYCHGFMNMTGIVPFMKEGENECINCIREIFA